MLVTMVRDFAPAFFRTSAQLRRALDMTGATRGAALRALHAYALSHSTPDAADPSLRRADAPLRTLVKAPTVRLDDLHTLLDEHLTPLDPVALDYTLQLDGPSPSAIVCHDVEVAWALKAAMLKLPPFLERLDVKPQLDACDTNITGMLS